MHHDWLCLQTYDIRICLNIMHIEINGICFWINMLATGLVNLRTGLVLGWETYVTESKHIRNILSLFYSPAHSPKVKKSPYPAERHFSGNYAFPGSSIPLQQNPLYGFNEGSVYGTMTALTPWNVLLLLFSPLSHKGTSAKSLVTHVDH